MNFPLYMKDAFGYEAGLVLVTVVGFFFGFVLERAGFGRAQNIVAQFYFTNMRVLKVMFTAVATAALGLAVLGGFGVLDLAAITIPPSFLWPAVVGGLLVGAGMAVSGYCPGTCVVAAASGNLDGVAAFGGIVLGSVLFGFAYPAVEAFYLSTPLEGILLPELLGVPLAVLAAAVLLVAVAAFLGGEKVERIFARRNNTEPPRSAPHVRNRVFAGLGGLAALALISLAVGSKAAPPVPVKASTKLGAMQLAQTLIQDPASLHLIDLRAPSACKASTIPGATCLPDRRAGIIASLPPTRTLVLFDAAGIDRLPPAARRFGGPVAVLDGGYAAFKSAVLRQPAPPATPTPRAMEDYRLRAAIHGHFTGVKVKAAPTMKLRKVERKIKKGGGC